jgi:hypothetical protein
VSRTSSKICETPIFETTKRKWRSKCEETEETEETRSHLATNPNESLTVGINPNDQELNQEAPKTEAPKTEAQSVSSIACRSNSTKCELKTESFA